MGLARITLNTLKQWFSNLFVSCAHFPCMRTHTTLCMAWLNPPTEEGPSPKRFVYFNKFDTFQRILALYTTFQQCHALHEFFAQFYLLHSKPGNYACQKFQQTAKIRQSLFCLNMIPQIRAVYCRCRRSNRDGRGIFQMLQRLHTQICRTT